MNFKFLVLIFSLLGNFAHSDGYRSDCLKYENGKVTLCDPKASVYVEEGPNLKIFASGKTADRIAAQRLKLAEDKILQTIDRLQNRVFPIVDQEGGVFGTAFRYGNQTLTALHVVHWQS